MEKLILKLKEELFDLMTSLPEKDINTILHLLAIINYDEYCKNQLNNEIQASFFQTQKFSLPEIITNNITNTNNKGKSENVFKLTKFMSSLPVFNDYKLFYSVVDSYFESLLHFFKYKSYKKGEYIYDHGNNCKYFFILLCGHVEYKLYQCPNFLRSLLLKITKLNLEIVMSRIFDIELSYFNDKIKTENPELNLMLINKIQKSSLGDELISKLLEEKYVLPKTILYTRPGELFGLDEIVSETRKLKLDTTAKALTPVHVLYVDKNYFLRYLGRNLLNSLSDKYEYMEQILPFMKDSYKGKLLLRKARHLVRFFILIIRFIFSFLTKEILCIRKKHMANFYI